MTLSQMLLTMMKIVVGLKTRFRRLQYGNEAWRTSIVCLEGPVVFNKPDNILSRLQKLCRSSITRSMNELSQFRGQSR